MQDPGDVSKGEERQGWWSGAVSAEKLSVLVEENWVQMTSMRRTGNLEWTALGEVEASPERAAGTSSPLPASKMGRGVRRAEQSRESKQERRKQLWQCACQVLAKASASWNHSPRAQILDVEVAGSQKRTPFFYRMSLLTCETRQCFCHDFLGLHILTCEMP